MEDGTEEKVRRFLGSRFASEMEGKTVSVCLSNIIYQSRKILYSVFILFIDSLFFSIFYFLTQKFSYMKNSNLYTKFFFFLIKISLTIIFIF